MTMLRIELDAILEKHATWLEDHDTGECADLYGADLYGADLCGANLREANLYGADLCGANLREANLCGADLRWADLRMADLSRADLRWADLSGADLRWADLRMADLSRADGIISFGPIGRTKRIGYAWVDSDGKPVIMLGCHVGNLEETITAIRAKYGNGSSYEAVVVAYANELMSRKAVQ